MSGYWTPNPHAQRLSTHAGEEAPEKKVAGVGGGRAILSFAPLNGRPERIGKRRKDWQPDRRSAILNDAARVQLDLSEQLTTSTVHPGRGKANRPGQLQAQAAKA